MVQFNRDIRPYILLTLAAAIWGVATPVIKYTVTSVPPFSFLTLRFLFAGIILLPFAINTIRSTKIAWKRGKHLVVLSLTTNIFTLSLVFLALSKTTAIEGAVISSLTPLVVTALGSYFLKEVIRKHEIEGLLIALVGTLLIIFEPLISGSSINTIEKLSFEGNLLFAFAILIDAGSTVYLKKHLSHDKLITPFKYITLTYCLTAFLFIPLGIGEQMALYNNRNSETSLNVRPCKISDYDVGTYAKDSKCTSMGCYTISTNQQITYFCKSIDNSTTFIGFLLNNLVGYLSPSNLSGILYMAIFSGIIAYFFYAMGLRQIPASEASMFYYLQPLFGIPISMILLQEKATLLFFIGAILILFGIFKAEIKDARNMLK